MIRLDKRWNWDWYCRLSRAIHGCPLCSRRIGPHPACADKVDVALMWALSQD